MAKHIQSILNRLRTLESRVVEYERESANTADSYSALVQRAQQFALAHSGSWFGDHALTYFSELQPPPPGAGFDVEWGFIGEQDPGWEVLGRHEINRLLYGEDHVEICNTLERQETQLRERLVELAEAVSDALNVLQEKVSSVAAITEAVRKLRVADPAKRLKEELERAPRMTRDSREIIKGSIAPQHVVALAYVDCIRDNARVAISLARQIRRSIEMTAMEAGADRDSDQQKSAFIGHGRNPVWRELKDFLTSRLKLSCEEFNSTSPAGMATTDRLTELLERSSFAFLVFTAEDAHADSSLHARENVIHEAGLFQGHLGFRRAIIVLEEGCAEFSNVAGLGQIRFPSGRIAASFEEIRSVLEREGLVPKS